MGDYFKNLSHLDPHLNALVVTRLKEIQKQKGLERVSIEELSERDELELLREYCLTLYKEYRNLRSFFIENLHENPQSQGFLNRKN